VKEEALKRLVPAQAAAAKDTTGIIGRHIFITPTALSKLHVIRTEPLRGMCRIRESEHEWGLCVCGVYFTRTFALFGNQSFPKFRYADMLSHFKSL
jgi:hypothetical protein